MQCWNFFYYNQNKVSVFFHKKIVISNEKLISMGCAMMTLSFGESLSRLCGSRGEACSSTNRTLKSATQQTMTKEQNPDYQKLIKTPEKFKKKEKNSIPFPRWYQV